MAVPWRNQFLVGHVLDRLGDLPQGAVHTCVTSPPYYNLRKYGTADQPWPEISYSPMLGLPQIVVPEGMYDLGNEPTIEAYVGHLVLVFRYVWQVLRDDGTLWLNLGDSMSVGGYLRGVPWRVALALQAEGWLLRSEIIWAKGVSFCPTYSGSCMPESVNGWRWGRHRRKTGSGRRGLEDRRVGASPARPQQDHNGRDFAPSATWEECPGCPECNQQHGYVLRKAAWRPTRSHEQVFLFSKSKRYFCDAESVKEPTSGGAHPRGSGVNPKAADKASRETRQNASFSASVNELVAARNLRGVWTINSEGIKEKHYASFPRALVRTMVQAGTAAQVCSSCGVPYAPVVDGLRVPDRPGRVQERNGDTLSDAHGTDGRAGYLPTCACSEVQAKAVVLDPFGGSGTVALACEELGRDWVLIDLDERNLGIFKSRRQGLGLLPWRDMPMGIDLIEVEKQGERPETVREKEQVMEEIRDTVQEKQELVYVTRLETNLKQAPNVTLGRKTFILGRHSTGKSSLIDAFSLALTGEAHTPGLGKGGELASSSTQDGQDAFVRLELSDGRQVEWRKGMLVGDPVGTSIFSRVWAALYGSPEGLQAIITPLIAESMLSSPGELWSADVVARVGNLVPEVFHDDLEDLISEARDHRGSDWTGGVAEALTFLIGLAAKKSRGARQAVQAVERVQPEPWTSTDQDELAGLRLIRQLAPNMNPGQHVVELAEETRQVKERIAMLRAQAQESRTLLNELTVEHQKTAAQLHILKEMLKTINIIFQWAPDLGWTMESSILCPCDGEHRVTLAQLNTRAGILQGGISQLNARLEGKAAMEGQSLAIEAQLQEAEQHLNRLVGQIQSLVPYRGLTTAAVDLQARLDYLERKHQASFAAPIVAQAANDLAISKQALDAISRGLKQTRSALSKEAIKLAETRLNRVLPSSIQVQIVTSGDLGQRCLLKVTVEGNPPTPFRLLGGSERVQVASALTSALARSIRAGADLVGALIIDDAVWMDRPVVTSMISLLDQAVASEHGPSQVVFGAVEYEGFIPEDWTVIDLNGGAGVKIGETPGAEVNSSTPPLVDARYPQLCCLTRLDGYKVPVYWLGSNGKLTAKAQRRLLEVLGAPEGSMGAIMTGKENAQLRVVTKSGGLVFPTSPVASDLAAIEDAIKEMQELRDTDGEDGDSGEAGSPDTDDPEPTEQLDLWCH